MNNKKDKKYWAFISYSSKDRRKGNWLHKRLENYSIPIEFQGQEIFDGDVLGKNLIPIFKDREELSSNSNLGKEIYSALERSRFLVVLCSKDAAKSKWVNKEIEDFQSMGKGDRILALILNGVPNAKNPEDECFPPALRYPNEPIAGDLRSEGDGKERGFIKILAGIAQLGFDDLYRRHERAMAKKRKLVFLFSFLLITIFALLTIYSIFQRNIARKSSDKVSKTLAYNYFEKADELVKNNKLFDAFAYLKKANEISEEEMFKLRAHSLLSNRKFYTPIASIKYNKYAKFSSDGKYVVTMNNEGKAQAWDVHAGVAVSKPMKPERSFYYAEASPNGKFIVTVSRGQDHFSDSIRLWNTLTGIGISETLEISGNLNSVHFSPDGEFIVAVQLDKIRDMDTGTMTSFYIEDHNGQYFKALVAIFDAHTGKIVSKIYSKSKIDFAQYSSDQKYIVTVSNDQIAQVWDARTGKAVSKPMKHQERLFSTSSAQFSPDGKFVLTVINNSVSVWDAITGNAVSEQIEYEGSINSVQFSPDGKYIVIASSDKTARVWAALTGRAVSEPMEHEDVVNSAQFSPDGKYVVTASNDNTAKIWDVNTGKMVAAPMEHEGVVISAQFSPDGKNIYTISKNYTSGSAQVWSANVGKEVSKPMKHGWYVKFAQFSPDGKYLFTAESENSLKVWDATSRKTVSKLMEGGYGLHSAQFSPDGKFIVTATGTSDGIYVSGNTRIWDVFSGKIVSTLESKGYFLSAQFSPDGKYVVTANDNGISQVWDAFTGKPITNNMQHEGRVNTAQYSADGKYIVTASTDKTARVWDALTHNAISEPMGHEDWVNSAQFSPDGKYVVTASSDKTARVWDALTGKAISEPMKHSDVVNTAQFSPNGKFIVTASNDNTARVWDAVSGLAVSEPMKHDDEVNTAQFSPDGKYIVTASNDNTAKVWDAISGLAVLEPMAHMDRVNTAQFSPDGKFIVTASDDSTARVWRFDVNKIINNNSIFKLLDLSSNKLVNDYGKMENLGYTILSDSMKNDLPQKESYTNWYLTDPTQRTISFDSDIMFEDYKRKKIDDFENTLAFEFEELYDLSVNDVELLSAYCAKLLSQEEIRHFDRNFAIFNSKRATELVPENWEVWYFRSLSLIYLNEMENAAKAFKIAKKLNSDLGTNHHEFVKIYNQLWNKL